MLKLAFVSDGEIGAISSDPALAKKLWREQGIWRRFLRVPAAEIISVKRHLRREWKARVHKRNVSHRWVTTSRARSRSRDHPTK
jgi:hypothetical protein